MIRTLFILCGVLFLFGLHVSPGLADVDIRPTQVVTLDAWRLAKPGDMWLRSDRVRIMLLQFGADPPPENLRAWLYVHVTWRTDERPLYIDILALTREWDIQAKWEDFNRTWYNQVELASLWLGRYYGRGWYRCRMDAVFDYQHHGGNHGIVLLPYPERVSVGYSIDQVFLRIEEWQTAGW